MRLLFYLDWGHCLTRSVWFVYASFRVCLLQESAGDAAPLWVLCLSEGCVIVHKPQLHFQPGFQDFPALKPVVEDGALGASPVKEGERL